MRVKVTGLLAKAAVPVMCGVLSLTACHRIGISSFTKPNVLPAQKTRDMAECSREAVRVRSGGGHGYGGSSHSASDMRDRERRRAKAYYDAVALCLRSKGYRVKRL